MFPEQKKLDTCGVEGQRGGLQPGRQGASLEMQSGSDSRAKGTHGVPAHTHAPAGAHGLAENHDKGQDGRSSNGRL